MRSPQKDAETVARRILAEKPPVAVASLASHASRSRAPLRSERSYLRLVKAPVQGKEELG
jgi:hypothetical protein